MRITKLVSRSLIVFITCLITTVSLAQQPSAALPEKSSNWHGFKLYDFKVKNSNCKVVAPKKTADGAPWIWRARFFGHEPQTDIALLNKGFHVAYCEVGNLFGAPKAVERWDNFYIYATESLGLSKKVALEGMSRGGLIIFNWAKANPEKVSCIYGDAPVCDFKSWPGGKGTGKGAPGVWKQCISAYSFKDETEAMAYMHNPIENAAAIAKAKIPVMIVYGKSDKVVPPSENCLIFEKNFKNVGGEIMMIGKDSCGHHPHSLKDPKQIVDFILKNSSFKTASSLPPAIEIRGGLNDAYKVFSAGAKARVAFLGGSITKMDGWRNHVADSLTKRFPQTQFDFIFGGISSTDSTMGAFRIEKDIFKNGKVDLLFIESAVNELHNKRTKDDIQRAVEGIVRHAYRHNPEINIIAQYFYDPSHMKSERSGSIPWQIKELDALSEYYNIPSINQVTLLKDAIDAGKTTQKEFGGCHPNPKGHVLYAKNIDTLFDSAWPENSTNKKLPKALRSDNFENGRYIDIKNAKLGDGWNYIKSWKPTKGETRTRFVNLPVLETTTPGSELVLKFTGKAIGITIPAGYDAGIIEYKVDNKQFKQLDLFTGWSANLHIPWIYMLETNLTDNQHTLTIRMTANKNKNSKGTACRICYFAVN